MRHRHSFNSLSRTKEHRKALLRNLMTSLFEHGKIETTEAKAKAVIPSVERLIVIAKKKDRMNAIRIANANLFTEESSKKLFEYAETIPDIKESGFCRLTRLRIRQDSSIMVSLELIPQTK